MNDAPFGTIWWNGQVCQADAFALRPDHEGVGAGLGCFTTTRSWFGGRALWFWDEHRRRLANTARFLRLPIDEAELPTEAELTGWIGKLGGADVAVRINATARASGQRDVWAVARPLPPPAPFRLRKADAPIPIDDPFADKKTFHYGLRALEHRAALERGYDGALLLDAAGAVLEASHGNFFARFADGWATPPLAGGVLPGIVRAELLRNFPVRERPIPFASLAEAREACFTNSVRGVVPIVGIDAWSYPVTLANDSWNAVLAPFPPGF